MQLNSKGYLEHARDRSFPKDRLQLLPQVLLRKNGIKLTALMDYLHIIKMPRFLNWVYQSLILCLLVAAPTFASEPKHITFSCWIPAELPAFNALEKLYRESFAEIGYTFTMIHHAPLRSLSIANQGITDGECARVANYRSIASKSPLERVEVMIAKTNLHVWSHDKNLKFNGPRSLLNKDYTIAYIKGTVAMQLVLARLPLKNLQTVSNTGLGIKMLARKRFDILIYPEAVFNQEAARIPLDVELHSLGALMELEGHPYLHKRHNNIKAAFTAALQERVPEGGLTLP